MLKNEDNLSFKECKETLNNLLKYERKLKVKKKYIEKELEELNKCKMQILLILCDKEYLLGDE